jgi:hypothetical protein
MPNEARVREILEDVLSVKFSATASDAIGHLNVFGSVDGIDTAARAIAALPVQSGMTEEECAIVDGCRETILRGENLPWRRQKELVVIIDRLSTPQRGTGDTERLRCAEELLSRIEAVVPNWRAYRDLADAVEVNLHHARMGILPAPQQRTVTVLPAKVRPPIEIEYDAPPSSPDRERALEPAFGSDDRIALLIAMMDKCEGGRIDASGEPDSLLEYFCDDGPDRHATDTFNQAIDRGLIRCWHSEYDTSTAQITDAGREFLAAIRVMKVRDGRQPIETAPKTTDWRRPIRLRLWDGERERHGYWDIDYHAKKPRPFWTYESSHGKIFDREHQPTHWQPTASPPTGGAE